MLTWALCLCALVQAALLVNADIANAFDDELFANSLFPGESDGTTGRGYSASGVVDAIKCKPVDSARLSFCSKFVNYPISSALFPELEVRDVAAQMGSSVSDDRPRCPYFANARWQCRKHFPPCIERSPRVRAALIKLTANNPAAPGLSSMVRRPNTLPDVPQLKICKSVCEYGEIWRAGYCRYFSDEYFASECSNDRAYTDEHLFCEDIRTADDMPRNDGWRRALAGFFCVIAAALALKLAYGFTREFLYRRKLNRELERERRAYIKRGSTTAFTEFQKSLSPQDTAFVLGPNQRHLGGPKPAAVALPVAQGSSDVSVRSTAILSEAGSASVSPQKDGLRTRFGARPAATPAASAAASPTKPTYSAGAPASDTASAASSPAKPTAKAADGASSADCVLTSAAAGAGNSAAAGAQSPTGKKAALGSTTASPASKPLAPGDAKSPGARVK